MNEWHYRSDESEYLWLVETFETMLKAFLLLEERLLTLFLGCSWNFCKKFRLILCSAGLMSHNRKFNIIMLLTHTRKQCKCMFKITPSTMNCLASQLPINTAIGWSYASKVPCSDIFNHYSTINTAISKHQVIVEQLLHCIP